MCQHVAAPAAPGNACACPSPAAKPAPCPVLWPHCFITQSQQPAAVSWTSKTRCKGKNTWGSELYCFLPAAATHALLSPSGAATYWRPQSTSGQCRRQLLSAVHTCSP